MLIVVTSVALVTIPTAGSIYYYAKYKLLASESANLVAETKILSASHTLKLNDAFKSLKTLARLHSKELTKPLQQDEELAFNHLIQRDKDMAWRNASVQFDGRIESGLFLPPNTFINSELKKVHLRSKRILDVFGSSIQSLFNNVWLLSRTNSLIIYDAGVPDFVAKMPVDIDYTQTPWITLGDPATNPKRDVRWTQPLYDPIVKTWIVSAVVPVDANGQWIGMLGHDVYLNKMLPTLFQPGQRYAGEQHFLLDAKNNYIEAGPWQKSLEANPENFKPDLKAEPEFAKLLTQKLSDQPRAFEHEVSLQGRKYLVIGMTLPSVEWRYFRLVPTGEILAPMRKVFAALVAMVLATGLLVGLLIDFAVKRNIVNRLQALASTVRKYGAGELDARAGLSGDDEIAKTSQEFDDMAGQLKATLDAIPDLLFELDLDGRYHAVHVPGDDGIVTNAKSFIGKTVHEVLSAESAAVLMSALQEADIKGRSHGREYQRETANGMRWFELSIAKKTGTIDATPRFIVLSRDISERKLAAEEIENLAFYDTLTRLPNRRLLIDRLKHALTASSRTGRDGALLFIDLDHFKTLNDTLGHDIGDVLLQKVADRLSACLRESDTLSRVARLGGDEFVVVLEDLEKLKFDAAAQAESVGKKILLVLNQPYFLHDHTYHSTASIGLALFSDHRLSQEELLKHADIAMYEAKKAGRNKLRFYDPQMQANIDMRASLEIDLREALKKQQLVLHYQIQIDNQQKPIGAEALIRWIHPIKGLVPPLEFIPLAEETDLILPIGKWVIDTACAQLKVWKQHASTQKLILSINVSAKQFRQEDFVEEVLASVQHYEINPMRLKIEITESMLLEDMDGTIATMNALKKIGLQFSLDDFGTGYSSLQYLKQLPLDQLKIDQSFVRDIAIDSNDKAIVRTIIAMAKNMDLEVIAEGVETEIQCDILKKLGCRNFQGYLFGKPLPINAFEEKLKVDTKVDTSVFDSTLAA